MKRILWSAIFLFTAVFGASAQEIKVPESWDQLASKADEVVKVTMDKKMLQFASKFMNDDDDEDGRELVSKLNGLYVRSLEFKKPGQYTSADVEPIRKQLQGSEWNRIVQVESKSGNDHAEHVEVFVKMLNGKTTGLVVLSEEPTELVLVHLDGPIDPEDLDHLGGSFGSPKNSPGQKKAAPVQPKPAPTVKK